MRIVGGEFRGRPLATPATSEIRPSSDRLRQTLFDILVHGYGDPVTGARVLDLFAGTGALGLEALSRGARYALFVDNGVEARALLRQNIEAFGLTGRSKVFRRDATMLGDAGTMAPFDLVFADPPYGQGKGEAALAEAHRGGWLAPGALLVLEERAGNVVADLPGLSLVDRREVGDSQLLFLRAAGDE
jgi:16S rRNA (guanine966-N2)-methyltransferase